MTTTRVVIIGGGFGGLWAARALRRAPVDIVLIDRHNHHLFQPLLYQVATAGLSAPDIAAPLRYMLRRQANVSVLMKEVVSVDAANNQIQLQGGELIDYDYAVLAAGATHAYFGNDAWSRYAPGLKTLDDALAIRAQILAAFEQAEAASDPEERRALLTFAIIGGGPTGVELAGTLAEIARHTMKRQFRRIDPTSARILLIEAGERVLATFPRALSEKARRQLERLGVEVMTGRAVTAIDEKSVVVGEQVIACPTVLWAAGVAASPLTRTLGAALDRAGRILVEPDLTVPDRSNLFAIGDLAFLKTQDGVVPGVAPAAKQMGTYVGRAIRARLTGRTLAAFRYRNFGNLATIGRNAAVVDLGKVRMSGALAWNFWLWAHLFFLVGFRNRLVVLINWVWAYWTYQRSARIIIREG